MSADLPQRNHVENQILYFVRKYIKSVWVVSFLMGIIFWLLGSRNPEFIWGKVLEKIGEFITLVVSLHFLYEVFIKKADRQILIEEVDKTLKPQENKLISIEENVRSLNRYIQTVSNIVSYADAEFFKTKWKEIAKAHEHLIMIGDFSLRFVDEILAQLQGGKKRLSVYLSVNQKSRDKVVKLLNLSNKLKSSLIEIFHVDRFDWGFILIGTPTSENKTEVLINYLTFSEDSQTGYYIFGETAHLFLKSIETRLQEVPVGTYSDEKQWTIRIRDEDILDFILTKKSIYQSDLNSLRQGIPLRGIEAVCDKMSQVLEGTKNKVKVTHIAKGESIKLLKHYIFQAWLVRNYQAVNRGVTIDRIMLVSKDEILNTDLKEVVATMKDNKIRVRYCLLEDLEPKFKEDFSIYDDKQLVYICASSGGAWIPGEEKTEARHTTDEDIIENYQRIFKFLDKKAKEFS
jgi:hypothetical protein